jgi:adenylylsulfate kinase-like enzyme
MHLMAILGLESATVIAICGAGGGKSTLRFALARELAAAGERVLVGTTTKMSLEQSRGPVPSQRAGAAHRPLEAPAAHEPVFPASTGAVGRQR